MTKPPKKRLAPEARTRQIVDAAAAFFAEKGFAASTRELALRIGVTQALLYRYFPSKDGLIDRVFHDLYLDRWDPEWSSLLADRRRDLRSRLADFYCRFLGAGDAVRLRLFLRANLDGLELGARYGLPLTSRVLSPIVEELRHDLGLPPLAERPLLPEERELALVLHGSLVFTRIREHAYRAPMQLGLAALVELHVDTILPGARARLALVHRRAEEL